MNGVIVIDKEAGFTSFDVVAKVRRLCRPFKVGHTGTLDPDATGVLPVCIGNATRAADIMSGNDKKSYRAVMRLGSATETYDASGAVTESGDASGVTDEMIEGVISSFRGEIMQIPPMYSAIKIGGKKLYELAREGKEIEREARKVTIHSLSVVHREGNDITLDIDCSKGTYIRSLCHDVGIKLGCFAHMASLRRTKSGNFSLEDAVKLSDLSDASDIEKHLISTERLFDYPDFTVSEKQEYLVRNGVSAYCEGEEGKYRVFNKKGEFLSVSEIVTVDGRKCLKLIKSFYGATKG
ncbi:MAG: tRNA pseudouridine(55) synthase TruB [Clostridia bacterium]|nr:tRNA pseudouridine(55) synthase TruB [Clostridia bacterium]